MSSTSLFNVLPSVLSAVLSTGTAAAPATDPAVTSGDWYRPAVDVNAQVQLQGTPNISYDVELYVLDLFDTDSAVIDALHADGRKMICYFSAGTFENWRDDAGRFTAADKGRRLGNWPGERWLDVRSQNVRAIMADRLDLAVQRGCDGVDPDNVDGYSNRTGLPLTYQDQIGRLFQPHRPAAHLPGPDRLQHLAGGSGAPARPGDFIEERSRPDRRPGGALRFRHQRILP